MWLGRRCQRLHAPGNVAAGIRRFGRSNPKVVREKKGLARMERQSAGLTDARHEGS
jgi:hypothetical protein